MPARAVRRGAALLVALAPMVAMAAASGAEDGRLVMKAPAWEEGHGRRLAFLKGVFAKGAAANDESDGGEDSEEEFKMLDDSDKPSMDADEKLAVMPDLDDGPANDVAMPAGLVELGAAPPAPKVQLTPAQIRARAAARVRAKRLRSYGPPPKTTIKGKGKLAALGGKFKMPSSGKAGQSCDRKCPGRMLCNKPFAQKGKGKGKCTCPILFTGTPKCTGVPKKLPAWCGINMFNTKLTQLGELGDPYHSMRVIGLGPGVAYRFLNGKTDLGAVADWSSCAVVGSSGALLKKRLGARIDSHTAVIRFNEAPTKRFEPHVGKRTTLRIQNIDHCGYSDGSEYCLQYTEQGGLHRCQQRWWKRGKCKVLKPSRRLQHYVHGYWQLANPNRIKKNWNPSREAPKKLSAGFFGAMLAMHVCAKVTLFGFGQSPLGHYYKKEEKNKGFSRNKNPMKRHFWDGERACMQHLRENKNIAVGVM